MPFRSCLRLASAANLSDPAFELNPSNFRRGAASCGSAFLSILDLRRLPTLRLYPRTQSPTLIGCLVLSLNSPVDLRLAPPVYLPALPRTQPPTLIGCQFFGFCSPVRPRLSSAPSPPALPRINLRLLRRHQLRRTVGLANLCMQVQIVRFLWILLCLRRRKNSTRSGCLGSMRSVSSRARRRGCPR